MGQAISKFETNAVFTGDSAFKLYGPSLDPGEDLLTLFPFAFGADNDSMVIAYSEVSGRLLLFWQKGISIEGEGGKPTVAYVAQC